MTATARPVMIVDVASVSSRPGSTSSAAKPETAWNKRDDWRFCAMRPASTMSQTKMMIVSAR